VKFSPALVGFEEPENGVHPRRIELIAEYLTTRATLRQTQCIVTTHSPTLPDQLPDDSLLAVRRVDGRTRIDAPATWGPLNPLGRKGDINRALEDDEDGLLVSERIMRGDFDA